MRNGITVTSKKHAAVAPDITGLNGGRKVDDLLEKLSALAPQIAECERRAADLRGNIKVRRDKAASGGEYAEGSRQADGTALVEIEGRLASLVARRDKIERAIRKQHLAELLPQYEALCQELSNLSGAAIDPAREVINLFIPLRAAMRRLGVLEAAHERRLTEAGRLRGRIVETDPSINFSIEGGQFPILTSDLVSRLSNALYAFGSDAKMHNVQMSDYPLLASRDDDFEFDGE